MSLTFNVHLLPVVFSPKSFLCCPKLIKDWIVYDAKHHLLSHKIKLRFNMAQVTLSTM